MNEIIDWKIGEIKKIDDKFYQCIEHNNCDGCSLNGICTNIPISNRGHCSLSEREDGKSVIFKKLEKVGEPYMYYFPSGRIMCFQRYKLFNKLYSHNTEYVMCDFNEDDFVSIEIKQNKEDMGKNKRLHLKEFDIEEAKKGKPVYTRSGKKVRIVCFDTKGVTHPIIALIDGDEYERINTYTTNGSYYSDNTNSPDDLMLLAEKKTGYINIYKDQIHDTIESAKTAYKGNDAYIKTIKVDWEE